MFFVSFCIWYFADHWEKTIVLKWQMQSLEESTLWEDLDDMIMFIQINEMIKSKFL
jgi:hypothetical protein